jgi:glycosyltransferase involved in cell wall biosynthesis
LWFTNTFVPGKEAAETADLRGSGGWMEALLAALQGARPDLTVGIVTARPVRVPETWRAGEVSCFVVPMKRNESGWAQRRALKSFAEIVRAWRPDIIHIHGTERFFGLLSARGLVSPPTVISIQGLLGPYSEWGHYFGNRGLRDVIRMHRAIELPAMRGQIWEFLRYRQAARRECEILLGNRHFLGRTAWDRTHLRCVNPAASYHHVGEVLREAFWQAQWALRNCQRHRIIFTNAGHPRKGTETLFEAADILARDYPQLEVDICGAISQRSGYGRSIRRAMASRSGRIKELGALNAREMAEALCSSHVFVSPSFIDNSPNAVCEAQMVGMPVVASYTGGVPSLVQEGVTGLFFPPGDAPLLAARIREVFEDDGLAEKLGAAAHAVARVRHDPGTVVNDLLAAYKRAMESALTRCD